MTFDQESAELFLASETEWDSEPQLDGFQQEFLLDGALDSNGDYTIASIGAMVYLGLTWKLTKAIEYHEGDEKVIFDHLEKMLLRWAAFADPSVGAINPSALQLVELEVGSNFT